MSLSYYLRIAGHVVPYNGPQDSGGYVRIALLVLPVWVVLHEIMQLYSLDLLFEGLGEYARVIRASTFGIVALSIASFWDRRTILSRGWVLITWLLCIGFVVGGRIVFRHWMIRRRARGRMIASTLIIGASERAVVLAQQLQQATRAGTKVLGFLDDDLPVGANVIGDLKVLGPTRDIEYLIDQIHPDELIIVPEALAWESLQEIVRRTAASSLGVRVRLSPGIYESLTTGVNIYYKASIPLLTIHSIRITGADALLKAALDYACGAALLALSAPFMLAAAIALRLSGAPFIIQRRRMLGLQGAPFTQYRFQTGADVQKRRTLARASLDLNAHDFSSVVGRGLYLTGFDKAPQLWNVMRGEMSLVGARAINASRRSEGTEKGTGILSVKPGMTGLWALTDDTTVDYELRSTLYYIRNWNFLLDLQILCRTITVALSGRLKAIHVEGDHRESVSLQKAVAARQAAGS